MIHSPLPFLRFEYSDPATISVLLAELVWERIRAEVAECAPGYVERRIE